MLEMKLLKTMEDEEAVRKAYEIGCYVAYVTSYKNSDVFFISTATKPDASAYAPYIYFEDKMFGDTVKRFTIQTTSYGALEVQEIKEMMSAYNTAIEVVEVLEKNFLNKA